MPDRHKYDPVSLRIPQAHRAWLQEHMAETGKPVRRILLDALSRYRASREQHVKVIITENPGNAVVGVIDDWTGPLPSAGDYIFHPPLHDGRPGTNVMSVKTVTWRMLTRTDGADHFTAHPEPCVEIHV